MAGMGEGAWPRASRTLTRGLVGVSGGLLIYAVANYLTLAIAARALGNREFGLFAVYYALLSLLLVPASALRFSAIRAHVERRPVPTRAALLLILGAAAIACVVEAPAASMMRGKCAAMPAVTTHAAAKANPSRIIGRSSGTGFSAARFSAGATAGRGRHQ